MRKRHLILLRNVVPMKLWDVAVEYQIHQGHCRTQQYWTVLVSSGIDVIFFPVATVFWI